LSCELHRGRLFNPQALLRRNCLKKEAGALRSALHFVTGNFLNRQRVFLEPQCCFNFLAMLEMLDQRWRSW